MTDETSLVQVKQFVKPGSDRGADENEKQATEVEDAELVDRSVKQEKWWPPVVGWRAEVDSMPNGIDVGEVTGAFKNNMDKIRDIAPEKAAIDIAFHEKVNAERRADRQAAGEEVAADRVAVGEALAADRAQVAAVAAKRRAVVDAAISRVNHAKEVAEAHAIKRRQAETAAVEGRLAGASDGVAAAHREVMHARAAAAAAHAARVREAERNAIERRTEARRAAVDRQTEVDAAADQAWVDSAAARARVTEEAAAATAHVEETAIEGAEGMKNTLTDHHAARISRHFQRNAEASQGRIDEAASGSWPLGDWPAGP